MAVPLKRLRCGGLRQKTAPVGSQVMRLIDLHMQDGAGSAKSEAGEFTYA
jgi:hypothetical protein